jgi:hypothetical protein
MRCDTQYFCVVNLSFKIFCLQRSLSIKFWRPSRILNLKDVPNSLNLLYVKYPCYNHIPYSPCKWHFHMFRGLYEQLLTEAPKESNDPRRLMLLKSQIYMLERQSHNMTLQLNQRYDLWGTGIIPVYPWDYGLSRGSSAQPHSH